MATATRGLTKAQTEKLKKALEEKAADLRANLQSARAGQTLMDAKTSNEEDLALQSHEEWIFLNRNSIDVMLLREIREALDRIESGEYGHCGECDEPISRKRLEAIPWARHCIECQEELALLEEENAARAESSRRR